MKNIGIITIHYGVNYGSVLQSYALQEYLKQKGNNAEIINYIPERYIKSNKISLTKNGKLAFKELVYQIITSKKKRKSLATFEQFLSDNVSIGNKIYSFDELSDISKKYDILIVGSDQVWNSDYNAGVDAAYYLAFAKDNVVKIAYAASCGKESYTEDEWRKISGLLSGFKAISLREADMVDYFSDRGINAVHVCDPIFLLSDKEWEKLMDNSKRIQDEYLLIYCLDSDKDKLIRIGKSIAAQRGLKTVLVSYYSAFPNKNIDYLLEGCSPGIFLSLMKNASFVVTNSFHGTAFSILFNKQFVVAKRKKYNSRIDSLLTVFGLMNRYVDLDEHELTKPCIDFREVNRAKTLFIDKSKLFIKESIEVG